MKRLRDSGFPVARIAEITGYAPSTVDTILPTSVRFLQKVARIPMQRQKKGGDPRWIFGGKCRRQGVDRLGVHHGGYGR